MVGSQSCLWIWSQWMFVRTQCELHFLKVAKIEEIEVTPFPIDEWLSNNLLEKIIIFNLMKTDTKLTSFFMENHLHQMIWKEICGDRVDLWKPSTQLEFVPGLRPTGTQCSLIQHKLGPNQSNFTSSLPCPPSWDWKLHKRWMWPSKRHSYSSTTFNVKL